MWSGLLPGRKRAQLATSSLVGSSRRRCLSSSGAVTSRAWSWFAASWVRAFTAQCRADLRVRIISTRPSPLLGSPTASPASTALAAACAAMEIGLAVATPLVTVLGSLNLHHRDSRRLQVTRESGSVAAGTLYSGTPYRT